MLPVDTSLRPENIPNNTGLLKGLLRCTNTKKTANVQKQHIVSNSASAVILPKFNWERGNLWSMTNNAKIPSLCHHHCSVSVLWLSVFITNPYSYLKQPHSLYQVSFHPLCIRTKCTGRFHIISLYIDLGLGSDGLALKQLNAEQDNIKAHKILKFKNNQVSFLIFCQN